MDVVILPVSERDSNALVRVAIQPIPNACPLVRERSTPCNLERSALLFLKVEITQIEPVDFFPAQVQLRDQGKNRGRVEQQHEAA